MLKVRTYLAASPIHGIGLFADEDIPRGTVVWEFNHRVDLIFTPEEWKSIGASISAPSFAALKRYSYKERGNHYLCLDNAQFMNHSSQWYNVENNGKENRMLACSDIRKYDELLCNYFHYSDCDDEHVQYLRQGGRCQDRDGAV